MTRIERINEKYEAMLQELYQLLETTENTKTVKEIINIVSIDWTREISEEI